MDESGNPKKLNPNHSVYFVNQLNGREFHLRMANHRATVNEFARREEWENNTGIVLKMSDKPLIPDSRVDYIEYVFLPPLLIQEKKQDIVLGIIDWVKTGNYSGPIGDMKPGISRRRKPLKMKKPTFSDTPPSPATPPDEPGVKESLTKYFQGTQDMKYRLLKEAALRELMEEDHGIEPYDHGSTPLYIVALEMGNGATDIILADRKPSVEEAQKYYEEVTGFGKKNLPPTGNNFGTTVIGTRIISSKEARRIDPEFDESPFINGKIPPLVGGEADYKHPLYWERNFGGTGAPYPPKNRRIDRIDTDYPLYQPYAQSRNPLIRDW